MDKHNKNTLTLLDALIIDILNDLTLEERVNIADVDEDEFRVLEHAQGKYIECRLDQLSEQGNEKLLEECRDKSGDKSLDDVGASVFILTELWKRLRETHKLRVVR